MNFEKHSLKCFCTVKTAVDNPMMNPSGSGGRRTFLVFDEGDLQGSFGYWAEDDEDGAERFLDALEDVFWIWDDTDYSWFQRRFQGRRTRKGKGKGRSGRRFFRPRNKGKGKGKRKGKSHLAEDESYWTQDEWQGYENRIGMKAIGPIKMRQHGNSKAGMNGKETTMMTMDISKDKERKERKEKEKKGKGKRRKVMDLKIKEKDKVMGKVKQIM